MLELASPGDWAVWLEQNHALSACVWLRMAKKASGQKTLSHAEALREALRYGWIDGQVRGQDEQFFQHKLTPRRKRSIWSKINCTAALALIESGEMMPSGLVEVERAQADGRWDLAYDSPKNATVPSDLEAALESNPDAKDFFQTLSSQNRFAILFSIQTAKKSDTRARRVAQLVDMLARRETFHSAFSRCVPPCYTDAPSRSARPSLTAASR